ncbi:MAG: glycoside hydrolase family 3 N-terminal domain-containing protein [Bacteroidia bacterium]|nr:glycoside hydrolase family 3 N-terminal domain-containing protein [Bacteroidia bacterium]
MKYPERQTVAPAGFPAPDLFHPWVEAQLAQLSPEARIAQLLHVPAWSGRAPEHEAELAALVRTFGIGGLIFFQGHPARQLEMTRRLQAASQIPMLIGMDAEWGLAMRLDGTMPFPYAIALGALEGPDAAALIRAAGAAAGRQCRRIGVQINYAPVADVNTHPANPVIGFRSFGAEPEAVAACAAAFMEGLQSAGVLAVAKHFPGHGDTRQDSHFALATVDHARERLDAVELAPFRALIRAGIGGIMTGHLAVPALEPAPGLPATLSRRVVQALLREEMGFSGLIFSDALDMQGVAGRYSYAETIAGAAAAGHDALIFVREVPQALEAVQAAVRQGALSWEEIELRCRRVLACKQMLGLDRMAVPPLEGLETDLDLPADQALLAQISARNITLLRGALAPLDPHAATAVISVAAGVPQPDAELAHHALDKGAGEGPPAAAFHADLTAALRARCLQLYPDSSADALAAAAALLAESEQAVISLHRVEPRPARGFGLAPATLNQLNTLLSIRQSVFCHFANPFALERIGPLERCTAVLTSYLDSVQAERSMAQVLLGRLPAAGRFPGSASALFRELS